jgi:hypothetical protein
VNVRLLGSLHTLRRAQGLPSVVEVPVPAEGMAAAELARELELPLEKIEAVFCNHRVFALGHVIRPGEAVAFVPPGTPGPHRYTLGIRDAGLQSKNPESFTDE